MIGRKVDKLVDQCEDTRTLPDDAIALERKDYEADMPEKLSAVLTLKYAKAKSSVRRSRRSRKIGIGINGAVWSPAVRSSVWSDLDLENLARHCAMIA